MATPDVRVRLSAEGVAEVVAALKTVQAQSAKTAGKGASGFLGLNRILGSTTSLLQGLGVALGVHQFVQWISSSIDAADSILKMGIKVGATTENLSALNLVARTNRLGLDEFGTALVRQNKFLAKVAEGSTAARATLRRLGLTLDDFKGKDAAESFELIGSRISALPSPVARAKVAIDVFGRSGANLIPTMKALADEGLGHVIERARELGVLVDTDLAQSARQIKDDFELLRAQSQGLGMQFARGFAPELSQSLQVVSGDLKQTTDSWNEFGKGVGLVVKFVVATVTSGFDIVGTMLGILAGQIDAHLRATVEALHGHWNLAKRILEQAEKTTERERQKLKDRLSGRWELALSVAPPATGEIPTEPEDLAEDAEAAVERRIQVTRAALDRELAMARAAACLRTDEEKRAFEQGLVDVRTYYATRVQIAEDAYAREVAILGERRALAADEPDLTKRAAEEAKIEDDLAKTKLEHEGELAAIRGEELDAVRDLAQERLALDKKVLESEGNRHAAAMLALDEEIAKADLLLRKQGASEAERAEMAARMRAAGTADINFDDAKDAAEAALASVDAARQDIQARTSAGLLSELEGESQLLAIEKERLQALESLAAGLEAAAQATGDPAKIEQARNFAASIREIGLSVQAADDAFQTLKSTAIDSATDALAEFLNTGLEGSQDLEDAFRNMALSVIEDIRSIVAQMIASNIMGWVSGLFAGGGQVGANNKPVKGKAGGGLLDGPGIGTSDSILIRGSKGEYVVREAVVSQPGVLAHLENLNRHGIRPLVQIPMVLDRPAPRFADGGLVLGNAAAHAAQPSEGRLMIGLDHGLILQHMETPAGQRIIVGALGKNKRAVKALLGLR